jgi:hypothetical protein
VCQKRARSNLSQWQDLEPQFYWVFRRFGGAASAPRCHAEFGSQPVRHAPWLLVGRRRDPPHYCAVQGCSSCLYKAAVKNHTCQPLLVE